MYCFNVCCGRVRRCFSAVWADGFSPVPSSFPGDVRHRCRALYIPSCDSDLDSAGCRQPLLGKERIMAIPIPVVAGYPGDSTGGGCRVRR